MGCESMETSCVSEHAIITSQLGHAGCLVYAIHSVVRNMRGHFGQYKVTMEIWGVVFFCMCSLLDASSGTGAQNNLWIKRISHHW